MGWDGRGGGGGGSRGCCNCTLDAPLWELQGWKLRGRKGRKRWVLMGEERSPDESKVQTHLDERRGRRRNEMSMFTRRGQQENGVAVVEE